MRLLPIFCAFLACSLQSHATFAPPRLAPVARLVKSAEAYAKAHPQEAEAHYTLARVHYLAFSTRRDQVMGSAGHEGDPVKVPDRTMTKMFGRYSSPNVPKPGEYSLSEQFAHASAARVSFQEALRLDPKNALCHLGLASLLEEVRALVPLSQPNDVPKEWLNIRVAEMRRHYAEALTLGLPADSKLQTQPLLGLDQITSHEAAQALIRLAEMDSASLSAEESKDVEAAKAAVATFRKLRMGPITPIVFSMSPTPRLVEMLAPEVTVDFDLRGYGSRERWPWVKPELGFLVWDPLATGQIESARDLLGSYSFQIFRRTGYDALAALDNNGDGELSGEELDGLRVWFDRDSDGVSTASEVVSLEALGITTIATHATARDGIHPMNPHGLKLSSGATLPTWDWIALPRERR